MREKYIKCINDDEIEELTKDKIYEVMLSLFDTEFQGYVIKNDYNKVDTYRADRFIEVE